MKDEIYNIEIRMSQQFSTQNVQLSRLSCKLCQHVGTDHPILEEIFNYVSDNSHQIHITELCKQVQHSLLNDVNPPIVVTELELREHFLTHQCDQKIVLNNVLRDLVDIVGVAKSNCVVISEETGLHSMEPKNTGVYLDAVKQIMSIYKQLDTVNKRR